MYHSESGKVPTRKGSPGFLFLGILLVCAICILPVQAADNPVPVVTKISPTYTDAGVSSVTITITGSGFVTGSVVQWNGIDKPTTYASATKLTVKIPNEDLRYPTTAKVRVYSPTPGGGYSKEYTFTVKAAYWIKSIWPAVVELDPLTLKLKGPNSYWEVNKANADPYGDYIFGLGVTGSAAAPQVYFIDAQTKFPSSTTKNSVWKLDMTSGKSTKVQALPKFAMGLGVPSPTDPNVYYYAEGKNVHIMKNGAVIQSVVFPANIGGIDVVADPTSPLLLAISRDLANQKVYRAPLNPDGTMGPVVTHLSIKANSMSTLYPYSYTGIAYARIMFGGSERQVLYVTKDDGTIEPWDRIGIVDFITGDILMEAFTTDLGIDVDPGTTWQSGTSGYLNYANPSGIDYVDGRLFISSLHYWNKGDKWPPKPEGKCISGKKWEDKDGDGTKDADEPYLANWKITLYRIDGQNEIFVAETTTDQNGAYKFCNLPPCTYYKVVEELQGGYVQTYPASPGYWIVYLPVCTNQYDRNFGNKKVQTGKIIIVKEGVGCMQLPGGMVGWWPGDGNADDQYDGNDGTLLSGASADGAGRVGKAFSLDGIDDAVQIDEDNLNLDGFGKLTLDAWVNPGTLAPQYQTIVSKYDGSTDKGVSYWLGLRQDGRVQFSVYSDYKASPFYSTGWTLETTGAQVPAGTFTHVAGVWNGGSDLVLYINGVKLDPTAVTIYPNTNGAGGATTADNTAPVTIGAVWREGPGATAPGLLFKGIIDEVEIFSRALTKDEIQGIVAGGKCKGIFHYEAGNAPLSPFNLPVGDFRAFDPVPAGTYTVTESLPLPEGWLFRSLSCDDAETQYSDGGRTAKIDLDGGETVICTYVNEKEKGKIIIVKDGTSERCQAAPANMVGWWAGDDSTNDMADLNPGTLMNGATYAPGKVEQAFSLDGTNDYVRIAEAVSPLDGFGQLTLDAWVKADTLRPGDAMGYQTIVAKYDYAQANGVSYWLGLKPDGKIRFAVYSGNSAGGSYAGINVDTVDAVSTGTMYHVAGVWDGVNTPLIYLNGVPKTTTTEIGNSPMGSQVTASTVPVTIGAVNGFSPANTPTFFFDGLIDEVEIFDRALTQTEIQSIVDADSDGKCKVLFPYIADPLDDFSLPLGGQMVFDQLDDGTYTVQETSIPASWQLKNLVCEDPSDDTTIDLSTGTATIRLGGGETVTCTYTNEEASVEKTFDLIIDEICTPGGFEPGDYTTYTQGGWGAPPAGNNPGQLLATHFNAVYPAGVKIGKSGGSQLTFTSAPAVEAFLPQGGTPGVLTASATNPTTSDAGVFAGQVLALQLNVDFSDAGITNPDLGDLIYVNPGDSLDGKTVQEILDIANDVLGGGTLPAGYTVADLNDLIDHLNKAFDNGTIVTGWAEQHLEKPGSCTSPLPPGAKVYVKLDDLPPVEMVLSSGHYVAVIQIAPGCYDWEIFYVVNADPKVVIASGNECIEEDMTNFVEWKPCIPLIGIEKDGPVMAKSGDTITFTYEVTNHGETPLANVGISDNLAVNERPVESGWFNVGDLNTDGLLDPGEVWEFEADYTLPAATPATPAITNVVTVTGEGCEETVTAWDDYTLYPFVLRKDVLLYWEGSSVQYDDPDTIFQFNVLHWGHILNPAPLQISEDSPVAFWFREGTYLFEEVNVPPGYLEAYEDGVTITIPMGWPDFSLLNVITYDLAIEKDGPDCLVPGETEAYTYKVTNSGPASVAPEVTDEILGTTYEPEYQSGDTNDNDLVDPGETWEYSLEWPVPGDATGSITNTARVKEPSADTPGWWLGGDSDTSNNEDSLTKEICPKSEFTFWKEVDLYWEGQSIVYNDPDWIPADHPFEYQVKQNGNVVATFTVKVGQPVTLTLPHGTYDVVEINVPDGYIPAHGNLATITVPGPGWTLVNVITYDLAIDKKGPDCLTPGGEAVYTYEVTNSGPASVVPVVTDEILGTTYSPVFQSGDTDGDDLVDIGEKWIYTLTWPVPGDATGSITNTARVKEPHSDTPGWWLGGDSDTSNNQKSLTKDVCIAHPGINVEKTGPVFAKKNDPVTFTYTVTNTGDVPLSNVVVTDNKNPGPATLISGDLNTNGKLDLTETWVFQKTYVPVWAWNTPHVNIATATGTYLAQTVTDTDDYTLYPYVIRKNLWLYYNGGGANVDYPTDTVTTFTIDVRTKPGSVLVGQVSMKDGESRSIWLAAGQYQLTEPGLPVGYSTGDPVTVNVPGTYPDVGINNVIRYDLKIDKTAPTGCIAPGSTVTYTYDVTNQGPASVQAQVKDIIQGDPTQYAPTYVSGDNGNGKVDPGETWHYTLQWTVPQGAQPGTISDTATVWDPSEPVVWHLGGDLNKGDNTDTASIQVCQETVTKSFDLECGPGGFEPGDYVTYTQGGWGSEPHGGNVGEQLYAHFDEVYPGDLVIGDGNTLTLSSASAVTAYLAVATGTPGQLDMDYSDPIVDTPAGVFGAQVLALQLNMDFADDGWTGDDLGPLVLTDLTGSLAYFNGKTVDQVWAIANTVLGGGTPPGGLSVSNVNDMVDLLNNAFDNGIPKTWAQEHLLRPCVPTGATAYASLTGTGAPLSTPLTKNGNHYEGSLTNVVKGIYDVRFYYVLGGETTLCTEEDENIQNSLTNYCLWPTS